MENFTPGSALLGGVLIGISTSLLWFVHGRIAGISGIFGSLVSFSKVGPERSWRVAFVAGMLVSGLVLLWIMPDKFQLGAARSPLLMVIAGVCVGWGTRFGGGCTSGHGVCGISRGATRSIVATCVFIATGALTVIGHRLVVGGAL